MSLFNVVPGVRVSDVVLYMLVNSDVFGKIVSDARLSSAIQQLCEGSDELLSHYWRERLVDGVAIKDFLIARWSSEGAMLAHVQETEAGLVVNASARKYIDNLLPGHVRVDLYPHHVSFKERIHDPKLPKSNFVTPMRIEEAVAG